MHVEEDGAKLSIESGSMSRFLICGIEFQF